MSMFILWAALWGPKKTLGEAKAAVQPVAIYMSESACVREAEKYRARDDEYGGGRYVAVCTSAKVALVKPYQD